MSAGPGRRFYVAAAAAGFTFANMSIGVPVRVLAMGRGAAATGDILAAATIAIAAGALASGPLRRRLGGGARLLAAALAVCAAGAAVLGAAATLLPLAAGAVVVGFGIGMFWVASQLILSRRAGEPGGAHAFLLHYATYTGGGVVGSALTGGLASGARTVGLATATGVRASSVLCGAAALAGLVVWTRAAAAAQEPPVAAPSGRAPATFAVQLPDLFLVAALALLLPLAPVVLEQEFGLAPFSVGLVMSGVALAKIGGTLTARLVARANGQRRTILILLACGSALCLLLTVALDVSLFVAVLLATALATTGAWPLVVDAAQARVEPGARRRLTVVWNAREYGLIALATALSGWVLAALGSPTMVFALAAALFAASAGTAAVLLRRPVWAAA